MAELIPAPFGDLVTRLFREPELQGSLFELPQRRWANPAPDWPDMSVQFHGRPAGNPAGPAAGPHTQMAQNILLSYVAGARILELKTVQVNDQLTIPRPCIDMTNVGYNVEWSQELSVQDSLREYVAGAMLVEMFRQYHGTEQQAGDGFGQVIYDISVGYDLAGIRSEKVRRFLAGMADGAAVVDSLRSEIPAQFKAARELEYPTQLSSSVTLSTFHGCPADEIERICEFLISEHALDVIIKMNPPMLGQQQLEHLLHEVLGYQELQVNPSAYTSGLTFEEAVQICDRLGRFAERHQRRLGFKFSNTLEVINHRDFFSPDERVMYLSGQPLHVITMALVDRFRQAVGPDVPISFSAGVDQFNFSAAVSCGFVPVTVSTDLLRPGGYGRLGSYLNRLVQAMHEAQADSIEAYILKRFNQENEARRRAQNSAPTDELNQAAVRWAGLLNTTAAAELARQEPRYLAERNRKIPKRIDSHLTTFDCITCDKCLPVCPNAANFLYPTPTVAFDIQDLLVAPSGEVRPGPTRLFEITEKEQIACYADFCNECGNCDTFCPEYGGPYIKKPSFFGSIKSWQQAAPRDGFVVDQAAAGGGASHWIRGRYLGREYTLTYEPSNSRYRFSDGVIEAMLSDTDHRPLQFTWLQTAGSEHLLDMGVYHTLRHLLHGVLNDARVNQVNVRGEGRRVGG